MYWFKSTLITLEQAINGVEGMRYIATDATSAGEATLRIIFEPGTDPNDAVIRVKTRVDQVMPLLPELVQREGVVITPIQPSMLMYVNLYSKEESMDEKFLFNYATVKMIPEIQRIKGVARAQILGSRRYAMRVWLNPDRMRAYNISVEEVMEALGRAKYYRPSGPVRAKLRYSRPVAGICAYLQRPIQQTGRI